MGLPEPLQELVARLEAGGYERRRSGGPEQASVLPEGRSATSRQDSSLELADGTRELRLVSDGGDWSVELRVAGAWCDSELVLAALDGSEAPTDALSDEELAATTLEALDRLPQEEAGAELLRQAAEEAGERRAPRLFGD